MPKTIKEVLEEVHYDETDISTALAEIRQLLKECEPEYSDGIKGIAIREYTANIEKRLG